MLTNLDSIEHLFKMGHSSSNLLHVKLQIPLPNNRDGVGQPEGPLSTGTYSAVVDLLVLKEGHCRKVARVDVKTLPAIRISTSVGVMELTMLEVTLQLPIMLPVFTLRPVFNAADFVDKDWSLRHLVMEFEKHE